MQHDDDLKQRFEAGRDALMEMGHEKPPPRVLAIVGVAHVDDMLRALLLKATVETSADDFKELVGTYGILGNGGAQTEVLYRFTIIGETLYKEIKLLHKIRNEFAHQPRLGLTFESTSVSKLVDKLYFGAEARTHFVDRLKAELAKEAEGTGKPPLEIDEIVEQAIEKMLSQSWDRQETFSNSLAIVYGTLTGLARSTKRPKSLP